MTEPAPGTVNTDENPTADAGADETSTLVAATAPPLDPGRSTNSRKRCATSSTPSSASTSSISVSSTGSPRSTRP